VHLLLGHLADRGFTQAPRPLGFDDDGREVLTYLAGATVGSARPWPSWVHSDEALVEVAEWLRGYHDAVADFAPPDGAVWREGRTWQGGMIVAHNDAAPYNAVWDGGLVGFVDWDMAGPTTPEADLAWMVFSWVPLHARSVVSAEGFTAFADRRRRLELFLSVYGWSGSVAEMVELVAARIREQLAVVRRVAGDDPTYQRMIELGRVRDLQTALAELSRF
jgi:aminoglycoside phosphotransferase (APT) family kinase protein